MAGYERLLLEIFSPDKPAYLRLALLSMTLQAFHMAPFSISRKLSLGVPCDTSPTDSTFVFTRVQRCSFRKLSPEDSNVIHSNFRIH